MKIDKSKGLKIILKLSLSNIVGLNRHRMATVKEFFELNRGHLIPFY